MSDLVYRREVALLFSTPDCNDASRGEMVIVRERRFSSDLILEFSVEGILVNQDIFIPWVMWDEIVRRVESGRKSL